jgi:hypothetical protein
VDPANPASVGTELAKQGPLGILALLLVGAIIILWRKLVERDATIAALQESRLQYAQKTAEVLTSTAGVMANQTGAIKDLEDSLRGLIAESQARRGR